MHCQRLQTLFREAKFISLFRALNKLNLQHEPELQAQRDTLSANYKRYERERSLMDSREYERAMNQLKRDLNNLITELCKLEAPQEEEKVKKEKPLETSTRNSKEVKAGKDEKQVSKMMETGNKKEPIYKRIQGWLAIPATIISILAFFGIKECTPTDDDVSPPPFRSLTVYVHGENDRQEIILENKGTLVADFGGKRYVKPISQKGEVKFVEINNRFVKDSFEFGLRAEGYELIKPNEKYILNGKPVYLEVREKQPEPKPDPDEEGEQTEEREKPKVKLHSITLNNAALAKSVIWKGITYPVPKNGVLKLSGVTAEGEKLKIIFKDKTKDPWGQTIHQGITKIDLF